MCHMLNLFDGFLMVSFTQPRTTIFLVSRNLEIKRFQVKLLWVRVLYEGCHVLYILSYHNFYICSDQSASSSGGSLLFVFSSLPPSFVLMQGSSPLVAHHTTGCLEWKYRARNLETTADWVPHSEMPSHSA